MALGISPPVLAVGGVVMAPVVIVMLSELVMSVTLPRGFMAGAPVVLMPVEASSGPAAVRATEPPVVTIPPAPRVMPPGALLSVKSSGEVGLVTTTVGVTVLVIVMSGHRG